MRCDNTSCWDRARHDVNVRVAVGTERTHTGISFVADPTSEDIELVDGYVISLCCGCYLRMLRQRRRAGHVRPWPDKPIPNEEFWSYFTGWEPEPEYPNDEYMEKMEAGPWRGR